jgi:uncharacterized membrane protein
MHLAIFCILIGIIAGLRAFMPLAAITWASRFGVLPFVGTHLAFLGSIITAWIFTAFALFELVNDKLPKTPSRKVPPQFIFRIVTGSFSGAAIAVGYGGSHGTETVIGGLVCGAVGAVIGTLGGSAVRGALARAFGKDFPAALLEDIVAIVGSYLIVTHIW